MKQYFAVGNWHDAGTGPFPTITYDVLSNWEWRDKPQEFKREHRYHVYKRSDIHKLSYEERMNVGRLLRQLDEIINAPQREYVAVESDWPEYEKVWQMIEDRVTGKTAPAQPDELQEAREELARVRAELEVFTTSAQRRESELSAELDHVKQVNAELMQGLKRLLRLGNGGTLFTAKHLDSVVNGYFGSKAELALRHAIK